MLDWIFTWLPWELLPRRYAGPICIAFGAILAIFERPRWIGLALTVVGLIVTAFAIYRQDSD